MNEISDAYFDGRKELQTRCAAHLTELGLPPKSIDAIFWGDFFSGNDGLPQSLSGREIPEKKFEAVDFAGEVSPRIENKGPYERLCVTTGWVLDLAKAGTSEAWFDSLSGKVRKKLRWIRNSMPKMNCRVSPLVSDADFADFEALYAAQFPKHPASSPGNRAVREIYRQMENEKRNFSRILRDENGSALAACLAYRNGKSVFYTHLTRAEGKFDKYSPGYYLTYMLIEELMRETGKITFFFMGPGYYEYKAALGAEAYPVFRYVKKSWKNLFERINLRHRARKEKRRLQSFPGTPAPETKNGMEDRRGGPPPEK